MNSTRNNSVPSVTSIHCTFSELAERLNLLSISDYHAIPFSLIGFRTPSLSYSSKVSIMYDMICYIKIFDTLFTIEKTSCD